MARREPSLRRDIARCEYLWQRSAFTGVILAASGNSATRTIAAWPSRWLTFERQYRQPGLLIITRLVIRLPLFGVLNSSELEKTQPMLSSNLHGDHHSFELVRLVLESPQHLLRGVDLLWPMWLLLCLAERSMNHIFVSE